MGLEGEKEDAPKRRRFLDGVDLRLGAIEQTNARKRERERERERERSRKAPNKSILEYNELNVRMHENT